MPHNVLQLHLGRDFNHRTSNKVLHLKYNLSCQQSTKTLLECSLLLWAGILFPTKFVA